jgi:hypothetical protein
MCFFLSLSTDFSNLPPAAAALTIYQHTANPFADGRQTMKKKMILVVAAAAGLSVLAVAQSDKKPADPKKSEQVVTSREAGSGMATGKRTQSADQNNGQPAAREAMSGMATGKVEKVASDSSSQPTVQPADQHEVKSPRDAASGLATGKRQHKPMTMTTTTDDAKSSAQPKK